jgi:hypothetical protein
MGGGKTGFIWIYGLIVLFATGIIELVIIPAIQFKLVPTLQQTALMTLSASDAADYTIKLSNTINFMHASIYVVMFVIFVYMIISVFQKEENEMYQP